MSIFDKEAKNWDKKSRRFQIAQSFVEFIKNNIKIKDGTKLLDYGCGTGLVAYEFEDVVESIIGMDNSSKMLEEFLLKSNNKQNIKGFLHDISKDKLPAKSFDLIVSSMTLHHLKNVDLFFKEANNALLDGGYLAIGDLDEEDGTFHDRGNDGVFHFGFKDYKVKEFFENNGFKLIKFENIFFIDKNNKEYKIFGAVGKKIDTL